MSQITRCPSCATLFKVVPDQLRISDGWVRCGNCQEVFDATLSLQETPAPVLSPGLGAEGQAPADAIVASEWSGSAAQNVSVADADAVPATAALSQDTELDLLAAEMPVDHTTPEVEQILFEGKATEDAATAEWLSALPEPDAALEQAEASLQGLRPAGYELPAALLTDPDGEEEWATNETRDEFPLQQTLSAGPQKASTSPAAAVWEPPFTPELKAASLPQDGTDPEPVKVFFTSSAAVKAEKTDGTNTAQHWSAGTAHAANRVPATPSVHGEELASETQVLAETMPEQEPVPSLSDAQHEPSFVRSARRKALWHRPSVRWALGAVALLLTAALLLQVAVQQRHYLASAHPQWRPALEALCVSLRCDVQPYQHIASVVVDGSAFNKLRGNTYRFALALKNQSAVPVALPAVELTLTDTSDQPVLRRVLTPSELGAPAALPAGGEWSASLEMDLALDSDMPARIAGYRVLAFYP